MDGFLITHDCQQYYFILLSASLRRRQNFTRKPVEGCVCDVGYFELPGYQWFFSRVQQTEILTDTENRARKTSDIQGAFQQK